MSVFSEASWEVGPQWRLRAKVAEIRGNEGCKVKEKQQRLAELAFNYNVSEEGSGVCAASLNRGS